MKAPIVALSCQKTGHHEKRNCSPGMGPMPAPRTDAKLRVHHLNQNKSVEKQYNNNSHNNDDGDLLFINIPKIGNCDKCA